jgi:hypothetical protein
VEGRVQRVVVCVNLLRGDKRDSGTGEGGQEGKRRRKDEGGRREKVGEGGRGEGAPKKYILCINCVQADVCFGQRKNFFNFQVTNFSQ